VNPTLCDSSVLLDVFTQDPTWHDWSSAHLANCGAEAPLVVNPVVFAEVSVRFLTIEELNAALPRDVFERAPIPWEAAYLAGRAHAKYRRAGGTARTPLPDLYIGAHAAIAGLRLLTRDPRRVRTYFPTVDLVCPG
jgi:predicted nucleic acid-binding protein